MTVTVVLLYHNNITHVNAMFICAHYRQSVFIRPMKTKTYETNYFFFLIISHTVVIARYRVSYLGKKKQ